MTSEAAFEELLQKESWHVVARIVEETRGQLAGELQEPSRQVGFAHRPLLVLNQETGSSKSK